MISNIDHKGGINSDGDRYSARNILKLWGMASALLIILCVVSLLIGTKIISLRMLSDIVLGRETGVLRDVFYHIRVPRTIAAVMAGVAFASSGATIQVALNNSIASPNIIGVNSGAGFATLICMAVMPHNTAILPAAAFVGALLCALFIYVIALNTGASRATIVLAGIVVTNIVNSCSNVIKTIYPDIMVAYNTFSVGGLSNITMKQLLPASLYILVGFIWLTFMSYDMNVLSMGDEMALSLGMRVKRFRFMLIVNSAILAGAAVSFAGLIGFVGLIVPHLARFFVGADNRNVVITSALLGACFMLLCDLVGRVLLIPYEIPTGIILSFVGGPYFIFILLKKKGYHTDA